MVANKKVPDKLENSKVRTILAPAVLFGHWTLCLNNQILYYEYDSFYDSIPSEISKLGELVIKIKVFNLIFTIVKVKNIPQQNNSRDCEYSQYTRCIFQGKMFDIGLSNIPHIRKNSIY